MMHRLTTLAAAALLFPALAAAQAIEVSIEGGKSIAFSAAELAAMPRVEVAATSEGQTQKYSGVRVNDLLMKAGFAFGRTLRGPALAQYLMVEASDGYRVLFALTEFDPDFTDDVVIVADKVNGQPLAADDGPWRLIVPREKRGARWVRQVTALRVKKAP